MFPWFLTGILGCPEWTTPHVKSREVTWDCIEHHLQKEATNLLQDNLWSCFFTPSFSDLLTIAWQWLLGKLTKRDIPLEDSSCVFWVYARVLCQRKCLVLCYALVRAKHHSATSSCKWHNPPQKFQNTSWQFQPTYSHTATWQFAFSCPIISPCWEVMSHQTSPAFPAGLHSCQKNTHRHTVAADLPRELNKSAFHQVGSCPKTAEMGHTSRFQMSCMLNKA